VYKFYKQSLSDKIISNYLNFYYHLTEADKLNKLRRLNKKTYTKNDLISVYIPTYNRADILIERAVSSILKQTYQNFEIIVVGDCCTDNTEEKLKSLNNKKIKFTNLNYKKKALFENVKRVWLAGEVKAANHALTLIKGKWISRIDDDEIWTEDHLEKKITFCIDNDLEFVSAKHQRPGFEEIKPAHIMSEFFQTESLKDKFKKNPKIGSHSSYFYRDYLKNFKYNENCWRKKINRSNDLDLVLRFFKAGVRIGFLDEIIGTVLPRPGDTEVGYKVIDPDRKFD